MHSRRQIRWGRYSMPGLRAASIVEPDTSRRIYQCHGYIKQIKPALGSERYFRCGASAQARSVDLVISY